jgi:uncharacterized protein
MEGVVRVLLRFRVANYRSIRGPVELSLVSSSLKTVVPEDGDWNGATVRVAGIYGANGAGKSTVLSALNFLSQAVRFSATAWGENTEFPHEPFLLDGVSRLAPSEFVIDLVIDSVRYEYGFSADSKAVHREWLYSYPHNRPRRLFQRVAKSEADLAADPDEVANFTFSRELSGDNWTAARTVLPATLFLSAAANVRHKFLTRIAHQIGHHIKFARFEDADRTACMQMIKRSFSRDGKYMESLAANMVQAADIGISTIRMQEQEVPARIEEILRRLLPEGQGSSGGTDLENALVDAKRELIFGHAGHDERIYELPEARESSGTLAWLSLVMPAQESFQFGETLLVDELDASLHPRLSAALVSLFKNSKVNPRGAQLIFTTHDTNLLSDTFDDALEADEIWFTEKSPLGETELFALSDFPTRASDNFERRYLAGRYGAIPVVDVHYLRDSAEGETGSESLAGVAGSTTPGANEA